MDKKVIPLFYTGPSVEDVLTDVNAHSNTFRSVIVTAIDRDTGEIICWGSGRLEDVCSQALMVSEYAKAHLRGEIQDEFTPHNPGSET
jgi:hypothetical protein